MEARTVSENTNVSVCAVRSKLKLTRDGDVVSGVNFVLGVNASALGTLMLTTPLATSAMS